MHKPESILQNEMDKVLWDLNIQMDPLILAKIWGIVINKKNNKKNIGSYHSDQPERGEGKKRQENR